MSLYKKNEAAAAAVQYDRNSGNPAVIATARGLAVQKMLEIAEKYNVPVYKNSILAGALAETGAGHYVPESLFPAVAEVFVFCMRTDERLREKMMFEKEEIGAV